MTKDPVWALIVPLLVLAILMGFGLWGVFSVAHATRNNRWEAFRGRGQRLGSVRSRYQAPGRARTYI